VGGNLVGRLSDHEADSHGLGRWTTCTFRGKGNVMLTIITAYQVCHDNISRNQTKTAYVQQWALLRMVHEDPDPNPRKQFIIDLDSLITKLRNQGHEILLLLDANESLFDTNCRIRDLTRKHKLADLHTRKHGLEGQPATYIRGKRKIDYIFGSSGVAQNTIRAGITSFDSTSDHRGLFVDVDLRTILGSATPIPAAQHRDLRSSDPKSVEIYRSALMTFSRRTG
jgi:exonuclease III